MNRKKSWYVRLSLVVGIIVIGSLSTLITGCSGRSSEYAFDVLLKGGTIYDGTLKKPYVADIGIKGDKIMAIGDLTGKAEKTIDARGYIVTPGFIDVHNHSDIVFKNTGVTRYTVDVTPEWKGNYNYLYQGVTTIVTGNCGWGFTDTDQWFGLVDSMKFGSNVYTLVPHGDIRNELFGEENPQALNRGQLEALKNRVEEEMQKGAIGFSTGLEYAPGCTSTTEELVEIAKVVKKYGGIYATHIRDLTGTIHENGQPGVLEAIKEAIEIGRSADIPVHIGHIQVNAPQNQVTASQVLKLIEDARREGLDVTCDAYPYAAGNTWITMLTPPKYKTSTGIREEYKTPEGRAELKKAVEHTFSYLGPEKVMINLFPEKESYEGKTIQEIAETEGKEPSQVYVELACADKAPMCIFHDQDIQIVKGLMPHEYLFTASDGWVIPKGSDVPHPRCYGSFPKKIRKYVLEEKLMSLNDAIRSMTSLPAEKFKMNHRGKIAAEYYADIAVIDLGTIDAPATYEDPEQYSQGIVYLLVNGVLSMENGEATGNTGGRALRRS